MDNTIIRVLTTRSNISGKKYRVRFTSPLDDITMFEMELATRVYIEQEIPWYHEGRVLPRDIERIRQISIITVTEIVPEKRPQGPRF